MLTVLLMLAAATTVDQDRRDFEKFWAEEAEVRAALPSKQAAWLFYQWSSAQFSLGFCGQYVSAEDAERMRTFKDQGELEKSEIGRHVIGLGRQQFSDGLDYRKQVRPTAELCRREMRGRVDGINDAVAHPYRD